MALVCRPQPRAHFHIETNLTSSEQVRRTFPGITRLCRGEPDYSELPMHHLSDHVWTAPAMQEESDASAMVGCGHVFGLLLQPLWPLAMM
jgi:hypothetical protein